MITLNLFTYSNYARYGHLENALLHNPLKNLKIREHMLYNGHGISTLKNCLIIRKQMNSADINYFTMDRAGHLLNFVDVKNAVFWCWDATPMFLDYFSLKSRTMFKCDIEGIRNAKRVIVSSECTKNDLIKYAGFSKDELSVVFPGVDHNVFRKYGSDDMRAAKESIKKQYGISDNEKIVLCVGSEQPRKNIPTLLKAISKTKTKLKLLVAGPEDWKGARAQLLTLITSLGIRNNVIFCGNQQHENLPRFYNAADVLAFPSYYEGFGFPLLEAMACGCPIITTDRSSIPEVVGNAAILATDPFDSDSLAQNIDRVLTDAGLRNDLVKKGLKQSQKFSWKKHVDEIFAVCQDVLKK